jgi:hypothetical protein
MMNMQFYPIVNDFVAYTIDLPKEFYELGLETDCYEAPLPGSPPGSLTPPDVYAKLIDYLRQFYNKDKAIEIWPPRGYSTWIDHQPHVFVKYRSIDFEPHFPIVTVFPRCRSRASNRNVPAYIWEELVNELKSHFFVVLGGTPSGSALADYEDSNVLNLIRYNEPDKMEKLIHYLTYSAFSISSQSGPTHLSLLCGTPSYIIGHEKIRHSVIDNRFKAPVSFRTVGDYRCIDVTTIKNDIENFINILLQSGIITGYLQRTEMLTINRPSLKNLSGRKDLVGVEIGTYAGLNALNMLQNLDIKKLYLIDPYKMYDGLEVVKGTSSSEEFDRAKAKAHSLLLPYADKIVWIEKKSEDAVKFINEPLDFVYIDGNHEYPWVKKDLELYYSLVKDGGLVAGHDYDTEDYNNPGPNSTVFAVQEFFKKLGIEVDSAECYDDPQSKDWWHIKTYNLDALMQQDINTMCGIINEEHS